MILIQIILETHYREEFNQVEVSSGFIIFPCIQANASYTRSSAYKNSTKSEEPLSSKIWTFRSWRASGMYLEISKSIVTG